MDKEQELIGTLTELSGILTGVQTLIRSANDGLSNVKNPEMLMNIDGNLYTAEVLMECAAQKIEDVCR